MWLRVSSLCALEAWKGRKVGKQDGIPMRLIQSSMYYAGRENRIYCCPHSLHLVVRFPNVGVLGSPHVSSVLLVNKQIPPQSPQHTNPPLTHTISIPRFEPGPLSND